VPGYIYEWTPGTGLSSTTIGNPVGSYQFPGTYEYLVEVTSPDGCVKLDTTVVVVSRVRRGVSPFTGGQDHLSHRFLRLGLSVRRSVTALLVASLALGVLAVGLSDAPAGVGYWVLAAAVVSGVMATIVLTTNVARAEQTIVAGDENVTPIRRTAG
jgi:hypothetical protein